VEAAFRDEGITVHTGCSLTDARQDGNEKVIVYERDGGQHEVRAEAVFHGLGRSPNTGSLALENGGVETDNGRILCDAHMRTSAPHIFAGGDCTGPYEIVHLAIQQGEVAAHNILHPGSLRSMDYRMLISVVFTDPQSATVGHTEKTAKAQGIPYLTASYPFNDHGKSIIMEAMHGFVKLLCDPESGEILGGACVGPMGGELIHEIVTAMAKRMTVAELAAMPHYHPTLAEIWTYPAEELAEKITG
jgi:pyruvate/2-oxoglutarate dehydrogenase complex dihydrolipoamide dehydrogenase (E3) component